MLQLRGLHRTTSSLVSLVRAVAAALELCSVQSLQFSSRQLHTSPPRWGAKLCLPPCANSTHVLVDQASSAPLPASCRLSACSMKIYTKTGDKGTSSLYSGERANKDSDTFHALGDVDEVNSTLGVAREYVKQLDARLAEQVRWQFLQADV